MARDKAMSHMLEDIRLEAELTQRDTGFSHFSEPVMSAMAAVPRERFVSTAMQRFAYANGPLSIGHGQTISQPYIVALMTELLGVDGDARVLEVGTGSGYQCAVLAQLVRQVYSVEIVPPLAKEASERLRQLGYENIETRCGDGYHGWPEHAPYDGIIVTAAAADIPPPLLEQLKPGARLVIPVGTPLGFQELITVTRNSDGEFERRHVLDVAFVPLTRSD